jgi:hypothetical protein
MKWTKVLQILDNDAIFDWYNIFIQEDNTSLKSNVPNHRHNSDIED